METNLKGIDFMTKYSTEIWKDVVGYEGTYEVSNFGNVRSLDRIITYSNGKKVPYKGAMKAQVTDADGYNYVSLYLNQRHQQGVIHRLVSLAFIPNPDNKPQVNHIDGVKQNNHVSNLEWATSQENMTHAVKNGLNSSSSGESHYKSKFTEDDVRDIRSRSGQTYQEIADEFGVAKSTIGFIINRQTWKHVK